MVQYQLKLRMTKAQEAECERWLVHLASIWNWAIRKIELNAKDHIYFSSMEFQNLLADHGKKLGIPSHTIQGILSTAFTAWQRCFKKIGGKPKLKGMRNKLNYIPFPDPIKAPKGNHIGIPGIGSASFHKMDLPEGRIKCGRIVKRASGWYLCLFIDAEPKAIQRVASGEIGIDPGFKNLLTLSTGEVVEHPREFEDAEIRLAQAQRGRNKQLAARLQERIANRRKDRNHKLSRRLIAENVVIAWSKDNHAGIASKFGKSVASSGHAQLRQILSYKSPKSGTEFIEVASRNSTRMCSECGCLSGPTGLAQLSVRHWMCGECGTLHDRDVNAAINTLIAAVGMTVERSPVYAG